MRDSLRHQAHHSNEPQTPISPDSDGIQRNLVPPSIRQSRALVRRAVVLSDCPTMPPCLSVVVR